MRKVDVHERVRDSQAIPKLFSLFY